MMHMEDLVSMAPKGYFNNTLQTSILDMQREIYRLSGVKPDELILSISMHDALLAEMKNTFSPAMEKIKKLKTFAGMTVFVEPDVDDHKICIRNRTP